jgi:hypothetical protein
MRGITFIITGGEVDKIYHCQAPKQCFMVIVIKVRLQAR